ncbi:MAG: mechanosensitive ion channel [Alphaproteobacteria bacterium]|nr:mechanosensitive ion channel [Alphaproteobacteria bacterium]
MMRSALRFLLCFLLLGFAPVAALAAPMQSTPPAPAKAGFLPVVGEIGQQITELVTGEQGLEIEPQETFGTRALGVILDSIKLIGSESSNFVSNFAALPELSSWFMKQIEDPASALRWSEIGKLLLLVAGGAFAAGWMADLLLTPLRRRINRKTFTSPWAKTGGIVSWLLLSFIPVILFVGAALMIMTANDPSKLARFIVMTVVYALALLRLVRVFLRLFLAPRVPSLRFLPLSTPAAISIESWVTWFGAVMIFGYFTKQMASVLKVPASAISGFTSLIALIVVGMTITVIVKKKSLISTMLRGDLSAARAQHSLKDSLRLWLARSWHVLAIAYLVIGYIVTMLGAAGGFAKMQQGTVGTLLSLVFMRLGLYFAAKISYQKREGEVSSGLYRPVLRFMVRVAIWGAGVMGVAASWGVDVAAVLASPWGQRVLGSLFTIGSTLLLVVVVYEMLNATIERKLNKRDSSGRVVQANSRARTLLPMAQKAAIMLLAVTVGLVTLSELGVNIAPLLAGAGVLGVAVGFGSQTLVKDFLTGLSIILEDNIAVGDWVIIGGNKGVVENLSIRTVRLRDLNGSLHIIPFSEIGTITNESKLFGFAMMDVGVAYDTDLDNAIDVIRKTGNAMRTEPSFKDLILEDMEVLGVEALGDSAITIRARVKTEAGKQGLVRRAFLLRVKKAFDVAKIEIPFPTVMQVQKGG